MDDWQRDGAAWIGKVERTFGFRAPEPRHVKRNLFASALFVFAIIANVSVLVLLEDASQRWFNVALVLLMATAFAGSVGHALYSGAFGGRYGEHGRTLRVLSYLALLPLSPFFWRRWATRSPVFGSRP